MTQQVNVLWVEDENIDRKDDKERIEAKQKNLKIRLIHPNKLDDYLFEQEWDLFLVDYYLNLLSPQDNDSSADDNQKYKYLALTADGIIREKYPDIPIYCMSGKYEELKNGPEYYSIHKIFDRFLDLIEIQRNGHVILYSDAVDYRSIRETKVKDLNSLFILLNAPEDINEALQLVLPTSLREGLETTLEGSSLEFAYWVKEILFENPGILYDKLNSATYYGMTIDGFDGIITKENLKKAQYSGIFSRTYPPLWWKSKLTEIIFTYPKIADFKDKSPWVVAPFIFKISEKKKTKCIVCGEDYPDCLGISMSDPTDIQPVHTQCSQPYTQKEVKLYFEEYRGFKQTDS